MRGDSQPQPPPPAATSPSPDGETSARAILFAENPGVALISPAAAQCSPHVAVWVWQDRPGGPTERATGTTEAK